MILNLSTQFKGGYGIQYFYASIKMYEMGYEWTADACAKKTVHSNRDYMICFALPQNHSTNFL